MSSKRQNLEYQLEQLNQNNQPTMEKVDLLNELSEEIFTSGEGRYQKVLELSTEAEQLARDLSYPKGMAYSLLCMANGHWFSSNLKRALEELFEAKSIFDKLDDPEGHAKVVLSIGNVYRSIGDYDQAYLNSHQAVEFFKTTGNQLWECISLLDLATICEVIGDYQSSLQHCNELIEIATTPKTKWLTGRALDGIGNAYHHMGNYEQALTYYLKSLEVFKDAGNRVGIARALNDLGLVHQSLGDHQQAVEFYLNSLQIREEIGQKEAQCTCLVNLGKLYIQQKNAPKAFEYLKRALDIALEVNAKPRIYQAHFQLCDAYELHGDLINALKHSRAYQQAKEDVFREESDTKIKNLKTGFEVEKAEKDAEITRLKNVELKEKNLQLEQLLQELQAAQVQLVQAEKMAVIGKLTAGITHEINTPVGALKSTMDTMNRCGARINQILEDSNTLAEVRNNGDYQKSLKILQENREVASSASERIIKLVTSLKNFTRLDKAEFEKADIHEGLNSALTLLQHEMKDRVLVEQNYGDIPEIRCYPAELNQVFMTLLRNAAQAIEQKGTITIKTSSDENNVYVKVSDTGKGMPSEKIKTLFEFGFTTKDTRVGMGMGLINAYTIIQNHKGELKVESEVGKGSTFKIILPMDLKETFKTV